MPHIGIQVAQIAHVLATVVGLFLSGAKRYAAAVKSDLGAEFHMEQFKKIEADLNMKSTDTLKQVRDA